MTPPLFQRILLRGTFLRYPVTLPVTLRVRRVHNTEHERTVGATLPLRPN